MSTPAYSFQCLHENGDSTANYNVVIAQSCTLREFIDHIVKTRGEWGYIGIKEPESVFGDPCIEYKPGQIITPDWENLMYIYLDSAVTSASYHGGWSRGDWQFEVGGSTDNSTPDRKED